MCDEVLIKVTPDYKADEEMAGHVETMLNFMLEHPDLTEVGTVEYSDFKGGNTLVVDGETLEFTIKVTDSTEFKRLMPIIVDIFGSEFETSSKPSTKSLYGRIEDEVNSQC